VSHGLKRVGHALSQKKVELAISVGVAFLAIVLAALFLYLAEATVQPEAFASIPRALWWSLATLTTVGYGDVAPITPLGKILGGFVAIIGVGIIAMPAGILASSFSSLPETKSESK
jgi:voltage-gated potassium channel